MLTATLKDGDNVPNVVWWDWSGISGTTVPDRRGTKASNYDLHEDDMDMTVLEVTATYTDAAGNDSATNTYTIGTDPNPGPKFSSEAVTVQVNENTPTPYVVGTYTAIDGTGTLTYSITTDRYSIDPSTGELSLTVSPNFEDMRHSSRHLSVRLLPPMALRPPSLTDTMTVTVEIQNVDEPGSITFSPARVVAVEGETGSTLMATLTDNDGAGTVSLGTVTWRWEGISGTPPATTSYS